MPRPITALILLAALALAPPVRAIQEFRFEGTVFEPPAGWGRNADGRSTTWQVRRVFGEGRSRGQAVIQLSRPIPASEGPFEAVFARLAGSVPGLADRRPTTRGQGVTAAGHAIRYDTRCCARQGDVSFASETVGISDGRRHAILILVTANLRGDAAREARAAFDALVRSFRLNESDPPAELTPPRGAGGLDGTFTTLRTGVMPNAFGGTDFRAENEVRIFDPSGLTSRAVPAGGRDLAAHCRATPADCGTYRLTGGGLMRGADRIELREMTGRYGLIEVEEEPFAREGENLRIDNALYRRVPPLRRGTSFDGTWRYFFASSGSTAFSSGSVSSERLLTLTRDGRFRRSGFTGASSSSEAGGGRTGFTAGRNRPAESGRYEVEGFHLILIGENGARETLSLVLPEPGEDKLLVIDGNNYLRQDRK